MEGGWIKIHRSIEEWEWESDPLMYYFWVRLLVRVNYEDTEWKGITVPRGSIITSLSSLAHDMHLSVRQVRTYTERLTKRKQIAIETTNRWTKITICKYDDYQGSTETKWQTNDTQNDKQNVNETTSKTTNTTPCEYATYDGRTETKCQTNDKQNVNQRATTKEIKNKENIILDNNAPAYTREDWRFISSVRRSMLGNDKNRIAEHKISLFRSEVESIATEIGMTSQQIDAFVRWWTEHSPGNEKIRAEYEIAFDTRSRMQNWMERDKPRIQTSQAKSRMDKYEEDMKYINDFFNGQQTATFDEQ